jgi:FtsP/CotA-like multicopper oxidase with cupredoxin domain
MNKDHKTERETTNETAPADSGRRTFIKAGVAATAAAATAAPLIMTSGKVSSQVVLPPSPPTAGYAWQIPLPVREPLMPAAAPLYPVPTGIANTLEGECGRDPHPTWGMHYSRGPDVYEIHAKEAMHQFTLAPEIPQQPIWGYNGIYPGPTVHARYGKPVLLRIYNDLPPNHVGFGSPEISTHLHNLHTPSESDGFPGDFYSESLAGPTLTAAGKFRDHLYPNVYAGYTDPALAATDGDPNEALGTLWFHDHCMDSTASNVYKGLAGYYLLFDELDSGNENDNNPNALRLPSGKYDIPLVIQDKRFDPGGQLFWDQLSPEGVLGDKQLVNGVIQPLLTVEKRKYRFRLLNGGPTRSYEIYFIVKNGTTAQLFKYIANDGNLLTSPINSANLRSPNGASPGGIHLGVAERADIVFDFAPYPKGTEIIMINRLQQLTTRKPESGLLSAAAINTNPAFFDHQLMKIKVGDLPTVTDQSRVPLVLRPMTPTPTNLAGIPVRTWVFERSGGAWVINGQNFNVNQTRASISRGSAEIWELRNPNDGWTHPIHIHHEEGRILSRTDINGVNIPISAQERGRKDVYMLHPGHTVRIFLRFRDHVGKYPMHCHNLAHEDHAMMLRFDIVP